ncbi:hypothetical protein [Oceanobacillus kimchii]|nr:hypothetical protein [Oceanobacillus kimchii]
MSVNIPYPKPMVPKAGPAAFPYSATLPAFSIKELEVFFKASVLTTFVN